MMKVTQSDVAKLLKSVLYSHKNKKSKQIAATGTWSFDLRVFKPNYFIASENLITNNQNADQLVEKTYYSTPSENL